MEDKILEAIKGYNREKEILTKSLLFAEHYHYYTGVISTRLREIDKEMQKILELSPKPNKLVGK